MTIEELEKLQKQIEKAAKQAWDVYFDASYNLKKFKAKEAFKVYEALDNAATMLSLNRGYIAKEEKTK